MSEGKRFKWLLEVEISEHWVKAGFSFREDQCRDVAEAVIRFAYRDRVMVRVVQGPDPDALAAAR